MSDRRAAATGSSMNDEAAIFLPANNRAVARAALEGVYQDVPTAAELRSRSVYLTSGMMPKSILAIRMSDIDNALYDANIERYFTLRHPGYLDQPLWNFRLSAGSTFMASGTTRSAITTMIAC